MDKCGNCNIINFCCGCGLASSTIYDWRVRTNCSFGSSGYTAANSQRAQYLVCNAPDGLASSSITTSRATVSWTAVSGAVSYNVDYKLTSTGTWTNAATATAATSVAIGGLSSSTTYDWRVKQIVPAEAADIQLHNSQRQQHQHVQLHLNQMKHWLRQQPSLQV